MRPRVINKDAVFQPVRGAAEITGISAKAIREGCKAGKIPHVRVGADYRVDMPNFLALLHQASAGGEVL